MSENKKRLGKIIDEETGEQLEFVSAFAGRFAGNRSVFVSRTELGTYVIGIKRKDENGVMMENQLHLTKESLSALTASIYMFLENEKENVDEFFTLAIDDESGVLYKTLDDLEEEQP